jgi:surface antigen
MSKLMIVVAASIGLAGCFGGEQASAPLAVDAPPARPALAGALLGPLGQGLSEADRSAAFDAQLAALDAGQRRAWRGSKGVFGYVEPGVDAGGCREYAHTIYVGGRPRTGKGSACRDASQGWKIAS